MANDWYTPKGDHNDKSLSEQDRELITSYQKAYADAFQKGDTATMKAMHDAAEAVRAKNGYSGGEDGSEYIAITPPVSSGTVSTGGGTAGSTLPTDYTNSEGLAASTEANTLAVEQAVNRLENQKPAINDSYNELLRENEINNRLEQENLRRNSIYGNYNTTGMADSFRVAQSTAYQKLRNQNELERRNALKEIEQAINDAKLTGDINAANLKADYYSRLADIALENAQAVRDQTWNVGNIRLNSQLNKELQSMINDSAITEQNKKAQQTAAMEAIFAGIYDPSFAAILGIPESTLKAWANKNKK